MKLTKIFTTIIFIFALHICSFAQQISGKFEGAAELQAFGKLPIKAEIRQKADKISGNFETPLGIANIVGGNFADGVLKLIVDAGGDDLNFEGRFADGKLKGKVSGGIVNGSFELTRIGEASPEPDFSYKLSQSKEKWREDLRFLAAEIPKQHKNAFHTVSQANFEKAVADLDKQIPNLNDTQIAFGFAKILAMIGDGHTGLYWRWAFDAVPMRLFWFGKELRVVQVGKDFPRLNGARVTKIGGVSVEEIFKRSQPFIAQGETPQFILATSGWQLTYPAFLHALGAAKTKDSAIYEFVGANGEKFSKELEAVSENTKIDWVYPSKVVPLWLQNAEKPLAFSYLPEAETVYVKFQSYPRRKEFKKFADELFAFLDKAEVQKLVFDLRNNGGGDFTRGRDFFIKPLKEKKSLTEKGKLFVITGRQTFSAGMSNAADFRNQVGAVLVGEASGQKPNGYSESRNLRLPNSNLEFAVSTKIYTFADKDSAALIPDKLIVPDWNSFQTGRDLALEWILAQPNVK